MSPGAVVAMAIFFGMLGMIGLGMMWFFRNVEKVEVNHDDNGLL